MKLGIKEIMEIIPHRQPFLLIDQVEMLEDERKAIGYKAVSYNEPYFVGHFPGEPVMPGVLIVEALAQVGAVLILSEEACKGKIAFFGGISKARFRKKVFPGTLLRLVVEITKRKGPVGIGYGKAFNGEELVAEGELTFMVS